MRNYLDKFAKLCPKTGRFRGFRPLNGLSRLLYPVIGLAALVWILMRVIPKPSRINYPCIRTAMPLASGLISYIALITVSAISFFRSGKKFYRTPAYYLGAVLIFGLSSSYINDSGYNSEDIHPVYPTVKNISGVPIGEAKGIFPGRVVWVHNPDATNENCDPKSYGNSYYNTGNSSQAVIDAMVSSAIRSITGKKNDSDAWQAIFEYHNNTRGKGKTGYKAGEKIFIKINATSTWSGNFNTSDLTPVKNSYYGISETSPQVVLSVLRQLIKTAGVAQSDIYVGDPMKHIYKHMYDLLHGEFPDVHYLDHNGYAGREQFVKSNVRTLYFSDNGTVLRSNGTSGDPVIGDNIYAVIPESEYVLNIPMLKGHRYAGITMFAKNNFGSVETDDASHLHMGLVAPDAVNAARQGFGMYRVQVDLMAHNLLGQKNLIYLCDALWATEYELAVPVKWKMQPFNNDWMSSLFISFDPVAIESVGLDFLRAEFTKERGLSTYSQMVGTEDYLRQAADSANWPKGIKYNPDHSNKYFSSLGVYEHWNDPVNKQYSRNLGLNEGIELIKANTATYVYEEKNNRMPDGYMLYTNYPNPFNPSTVIKYYLPQDSYVTLLVYDNAGKEITSLVKGTVPAGSHSVRFDAGSLPSGTYYYQLKAGDYLKTNKLLLIK
ncbi:MAG: DUF362 domain-containing protein [Syntrophothermus sp.]